MRFVVSTILTALFAFACSLFFPWWIIAPAAFLVAILIRQSPLLAFLSGFGGVFIQWVTVGLIRNSENHGVLGKQVAEVFPLGGSVYVLILIAAFIGALVGGLAATSGSFLRMKSNRTPEVV